MDARISSQALAVCIAENVPVILWGGPGVGKTTVVREIARAYGLHLEVVIASIRDPTDFSGIPYVRDGAAYFIPPRWARDVAEFDGNSIILYDEISTATPALQAALLRPILELVVGDITLPPGTRSVGTANPPSIAADGWDISPPLSNRFTHIDWEPDAMTVKKGFIEGFGVPTIPRFPTDPDKKNRFYANAKALVGVFIGTRPELVSHLPRDFGVQSDLMNFSAADYGFPTPRSWEIASRLLAATQMGRISKNEGMDPGVLPVLLAGTVGKAASKEFIAFITALDLPEPMRYLAGEQEIPDTLKRGDQIEAFMAAVNTTYKLYSSQQAWIRYGDALSHFVNLGKGDAVYFYILSWYKNRPEGMVPTGAHINAMASILLELDSK